MGGCIRNTIIQPWVAISTSIAFNLGCGSVLLDTDILWRPQWPFNFNGRHQLIGRFVNKCFSAHVDWFFQGTCRTIFGAAVCCNTMCEEPCAMFAIPPLLSLGVLAQARHCSEAHHFGNVTLVFAETVGRSLLSHNYDVPL